MKTELHDLRKNYQKSELIESDVPNNPFLLFKEWFEMAKEHPKIEEANAMSIATLGSDGFPKNRIVLLKEILDNGFVFYTNYESEKSKAIKNYQKGCLHFFWPALEKQIIIKVTISKVSKEHSENYFKKRPRESQLGAWASEQSSQIASREQLEFKLKTVRERFENTSKIPKPEFWGGFICKPYSFEFWQGRPNRLHDRLLFEQVDSIWEMKRLQP